MRGDMTVERKRGLQVVDEWQFQLKADGKPWIILEPHQHWQLVEMITQTITEAVAEAEAEAVAHATGRLNMAIAVEQERERITNVLTEAAQQYDGGAMVTSNHIKYHLLDIAAAIRKVKP